MYVNNYQDYLSDTVLANYLFNISKNLKKMSKVLIVDDDPDVLKTLESVLSEKGFKVQTLSNQEDIYETILSFEPNVILLDVYLKNSDGRNICMGLKSHYKTKQIPVILFSGDNELKNKYKEYHAEGFLEKPVRVPALVKRLKDYTYKKGDNGQKTA